MNGFHSGRFSLESINAELFSPLLRFDLGFVLLDRRLRHLGRVGLLLFGLRLLRLALLRLAPLALLGNRGLYLRRKHGLKAFCNFVRAGPVLILGKQIANDRCCISIGPD